VIEYITGRRKEGRELEENLTVFLAVLPPSCCAFLIVIQHITGRLEEGKEREENLTVFLAVLPPWC
jgi:hypothetical protein